MPPIITPMATAVARDSQPPVQHLAAAPQGAALAPDHAPSKAVKAPDAKEMAAELKDTLKRLNEHMRTSGRNLAFAKDEASGRTVIRVTNTDTGELVRQIPNEEFLKVARALDEFKGTLLDQII